MSAPGVGVRRIARDVADVMRTPITSEGVYYEHDDEDVYEGWAAIVGKPGTPYVHGCYTFHLRFPQSYPTAPPEVTARTQDPAQRTRFHPNLYRNGRVCRSSLNTWKGEGWSSCMTLRSILLDIAQALNRADPFLEEPGVQMDHRDRESYNRALRYKNLEVAVLGTLRLPSPEGAALTGVRCAYREYCRENAESIIEYARGLAILEPMELLHIGMYEMAVSGSYPPVVAGLERELGSEIDPEASRESAGSRYGVL